jgi:hypothetical protein
MSSITCPFCGEMMDSPLRFCVACGRAITAEDLKHAGLKLQQGRRSEANLGAVSRRDFSFQRKMRSFMYTISAVLALLIGYYFVMKYLLHEHMPGKLDEKIEALMNGQSVNFNMPGAPAATTEAQKPERSSGSSH